MVVIYPPDLQQKNTAMEEKQYAISEMESEIEQKELHKDDIIQKIEKLKEEQAKRKECKFMQIESLQLQGLICDCSVWALFFSVIVSQNKANKDRLRNLQKARLVFQDHLGMEIRTILSKSEVIKGVPIKLAVISLISM